MTLFVQHDLNTSFTNYLTFETLKNYFVLNEYTYTHVQEKYDLENIIPSCRTYLCKTCQKEYNHTNIFSYIYRNVYKYPVFGIIKYDYLEVDILCITKRIFSHFVCNLKINKHLLKIFTDIGIKIKNADKEICSRLDIYGIDCKKTKHTGLTNNSRKYKIEQIGYYTFELFCSLFFFLNYNVTVKPRVNCDQTNSNAIHSAKTYGSYKIVKCLQKYYNDYYFLNNANDLKKPHRVHIIYRTSMLWISII